MASRGAVRTTASVLLLLALGASGLRGRSSRADPAHDTPAVHGSWRVAPKGAVGASSLDGMVRGLDGNGVDNALVVLTNNFTYPSGARHAFTRTSDGGHFVFADVPDDDYVVTATFASTSVRLEVQARRQRHGLALSLGRSDARLRGRVVDTAGAPIAGAIVLLDSRVAGYATETDGRGAYTVCAPTADYALTAFADGFAPERGFFGGAVPVTRELRLRRGAVLRGRVVGTDGFLGVAGATVRAAPAAYARRSSSVDAVTDGEGRFELRDLAGDAYTVSAIRGALTGEVDDVWIAPSQVTTLEVPMVTARTVRGTVRTSQGARVSGAWVEMGGCHAARAARADANGVFSIEGVPLGCSAYTSVDGHGDWSHPSVPDDAPVATVDITIADRRAIRGIVVDDHDRPVEGAEVALSGYFIDVEDYEGETRTNARGEFDFDWPVAIRHTLRASHASGAAVMEGVVVDAGDANVKLVLKPNGVVAGNVRWQDGTPAAGVVVSSQAWRYPTRRVSTDAKGQFAVPVPAGAESSVWADVEAQEWPARSSHHVTVGPAQRFDRVSLTLECGRHRITGRVKDPSGAPVRRAAVAVGEDLMSFASSSLPITYTDAGGFFAFEGVRKAPYQVVIRFGDFPTTVVPDVSPDGPPVEVTLPRGGSIAGTVQNPGGHTPARLGSVVARVGLQPVPDPFSGIVSNESYVTAGTFLIKRLRAAPYTLTAGFGEGFGQTLVTLHEGEQLQGVSIVLRR